MAPLGGGKSVKVEFSVIAATNRNLDDGSPEQFRSDLFFRIADYTVRLPALREQADRDVLIRSMWNRLTYSCGMQLHADTIDRLSAYDWPGNLRQLNGVLRTLIALAGKSNVVMPCDLPELILRSRSNSPLALVDRNDAPLCDITERAMREALQKYEGNVSAAARSLGISRSTLYRRLS